MVRCLRYSILKLLTDYSSINEPLSLNVIIAHLPSFSYKNIQVQLCSLQGKGFVSRIGAKCNYQYHITKAGLHRLRFLETKIMKEELIEAFNLELALFNAYT
jgi:hypothetical protein